MIDTENMLIKPVVHALEHAVVFSILVRYREIFFYTQNAIETHVLSNLNGICAPWGYHFTARAYKKAFELVLFQEGSVAEKPAKFLNFMFTGLMINFGSNDVLSGGLKEKNHKWFYLMVYTLYKRYCKGSTKRWKAEAIYQLFSFL